MTRLELELRLECGGPLNNIPEHVCVHAMITRTRVLRQIEPNPVDPFFDLHRFGRRRDSREPSSCGGAALMHENSPREMGALLRSVSIRWAYAPRRKSRVQREREKREASLPTIMPTRVKIER